MSAQPTESLVELPELSAIQTYGPGYWSRTLCLATHWEPGDLQPAVCAREVHLPDDDRHLTAIWSHAGHRAEQTTWREGS